MPASQIPIPSSGTTVEDEMRRLPRMSRNRRIALKRELEAKIAAHGFTLQYVEFCESAQTPGILGYYRGVTSHRDRTVRIATKKSTPLGIADCNILDLIAVLTHELHHVEDAAWDCGNRLIR